MTEYLAVRSEVRAALNDRRPVVALESTIVAHGMPWPKNLETARRVEAAVRDEGAVPATVAVSGGAIRVGLGDGEIETLARGGERVRKLSRRDLAIALAAGEDGATTVAATMIAAARAGIRVFATGGIGGVHRGAAESFDVSADLHELARSPVAVVCAGAKSVLDLRLTLEVLETLGVPVIGLGTDKLPAFYVRDSGLALDHRATSEREVARILATHWALGGGGAVVANPIPERHALAPELVERAIDEALADAAERGIRGKAVTPYLLSRIEALTGGASLDANRALVVSNARVAARLAAELLLLD